MTNAMIPNPMKAKLVDIQSPNIEDLSTFIPQNNDNFNLLIEATVGYAGQEIKGGDVFSFEVVTPKWLMSNYQNSDIIMCCHTIIVFEYDYLRIYNRLKKIIESCTGETWDEIALKLSRYGYWEFEDYQI